MLLGIIVLVAIILVLLGVGIYNIRTGSKTQPGGLVVAWHRKPAILFGISNIIFALLMLLVSLLIFLPALRIVFLILIALAFLASILLVIRTIMASVELTRRLKERGSARPPEPE